MQSQSKWRLKKTLFLLALEVLPGVVDYFLDDMQPASFFVIAGSCYSKKEGRIFADMYEIGGSRNEGIPAKNNRCHFITLSDQLLSSFAAEE